MKRQIILSAALVWCFGVTECALAQDKAAPAEQGDGTAAASAPAVKKLTIEVSGGEKNVAVENASVPSDPTSRRRKIPTVVWAHAYKR